jgi:homoserine kinase
VIPGASENHFTAFAPASVANLGVGFDVLGLALQAPGDTVSARLSETPGVRITSVRSTIAGEKPLTIDPARNTAAVAAREVLALAGVDAGVDLEIVKGLPIGSGMGSSAASAAAAAFAVNALLGSPLRKSELIAPCMEAEAVVSGRHADNVAPALLGGLVLVRSIDPLDVVRLPIPEGLRVVVVSPRFELMTRDARAALPKQVPLPEVVARLAAIAAFVSACHTNDLGLLARSMMETDFVTRARAPLIPGGQRVIAAALSAGALASSISGSGSSIFALCRSAHDAGEVRAAMQREFKDAGLESSAHESPADCPGARRL